MTQADERLSQVEEAQRRTQAQINQKRGSTVTDPSFYKSNV